MKRFLFTYITLFFVLIVTIVYLTTKKTQQEAIKVYVSKTTMSDIALSTQFVDIRFYSLGSMARIYEDPLLGEKSFLGFVYKEKDE